MLTALSWQLQRVIPQNQAELNGSTRTTIVLSHITPRPQESNTVRGVVYSVLAIGPTGSSMKADPGLISVIKVGCTT